MSTLIFCCYSICCSMGLSRKEIMQLKEILKKNGYDNKFLTSVSEPFWTKCILKKVPQHTVPKTDIHIFLLYLGKLSLSTRKSVRDIYVNLKVFLRIKNRLSSKFNFKDKISLLTMIKPNVTLRFVYPNIWKSVRTGKNINSIKSSALRDHMLNCNNIVSFEDFFVLASGTNDLRVKSQESILIHDGPQLNKTSETVSLRLFS